MASSVDLSDRARVGAEYLDRHRPGWWSEINTDILNLESTTNCVLSQLYNGYSNAKRELNLDEKQAVALGFMLTDDDGCYNHSNWKMLTDFWQREIRLRATGPEGSSSNAPSLIVTKAQVEEAAQHIASAAKGSPTYMPDLTEKGVLLHVLMSLGVTLTVEG